MYCTVCFKVQYMGLGEQTPPKYMCLERCVDEQTSAYKFLRLERNAIDH